MKKQDDTKVCTQCGVRKNLDSFYKSKRASDGHSSDCKECNLARSRKYRARHLEERRAYMREYDKRPHRKALHYARSKKWKADHPEKRKAHKAVNYALSVGKLVKPKTCSNCGEEKPLQGHHPDYSKLLDVVWLCSVCHVNLHKNLGD